MKHWFAVLFILLLRLGAYAQQEVYVVTENSEVFVVNVNNCSTSLVTVLTNPANGALLEPFDIAIGADGLMYFIDNATLYALNLNTLVVTAIGFNLDNFFSTGLVGMANGSLLSYDELGNIFVINTTDASAVALGDTGFIPGGDVTFFNDQLLLVSGANQVVAVNQEDPAASTVLTVLPFSDEFFWGLTSIVNTCEDQTLYATSTFGLVEVNLNSGVSNVICENLTDSPIYGAASTTEFLADDCEIEVEIEIDLDDNDSSGATGANFISGTGCAPTAFPVADTDASIASNGTVERISLQLVGALDAGNEIIVVPEQPGITVVGNNTPNVEVLNNAPLSNADLALLLANINYAHTGTATTPGVRTVAVQAFAAGESSNIGVAFFEYVDVSAGDDMWLGFCPGDAADGNAMLVEDATPGGNWFTPSGQAFDGQFEFGIQEGVYLYQVSLFGCVESAVWVFKNNEPATGNLVVVNPLCTDTCNGAITALPGEGSVLLSPELGDDATLNDLCPGEYEFRFINDDGCVLVDRRELFPINNPANCNIRDADLPPIYVPNAFTPDGDGLNDVFRAESAARFRWFTMRIYNRWGEQIFESDNINTVWQGDAFGGRYFVPDGVYVWVIDYAYANSSKTGRLTGHVTVVR
jgi:gliding motility-associated-like protein